LKILLVNPPNCGRSIPEEEYGITSLKPIFRGEPLALEALAGNLTEHEVAILDLKVEPDGLPSRLAEFRPDIIGFTGMTCEANTILKLAELSRKSCSAVVVVGGIHASCDPEFFNRPEVDYIVIGLGRKSFAELVLALEQGRADPAVAGICGTNPGRPLRFAKRSYTTDDLADDRSPAYHLVEQYRSRYTLTSLNLNIGFVATAFGCPFRCSFCCIKKLTDGRYLTHSIEAVLRDINLLGDIPVIRLLDANTFGDIEQASRLREAIGNAGIRKQFLADVRSDTVVNHPELLRQWKEIGLRAVIVGFEEVSDQKLAAMNKANKVAVNSEAVGILHDLGITIVGDFIISPSYDESDFDRLERYIVDQAIDLPMITVLTPLPGTELYRRMHKEIIINDLDFYTLTNAVVPTRIPPRAFYNRYAELLRTSHDSARL
jgi:hopanoid C-3 methylase